MVGHISTKWLQDNTLNTGHMNVALFRLDPFFWRNCYTYDWGHFESIRAAWPMRATGTRTLPWQQAGQTGIESRRKKVRTLERARKANLNIKIIKIQRENVLSFLLFARRVLRTWIRTVRRNAQKYGADLWSRWVSCARPKGHAKITCVTDQCPALTNVQFVSWPLHNILSSEGMRAQLVVLQLSRLRMSSNYYLPLASCLMPHAGVLMINKV